jgi:hypothetical protein
MAVRSRPAAAGPTDCGDASIITETVHVKRRKPVRHGGQTGFLGHGGETNSLTYHLSLNFCLKILSGDKLYRL